MAARNDQVSGLLRLLRPFLPWAILSVVAGVSAGAATVALLGTINHALNRPDGMTGALLGVFVILCLLSLSGRMISDMSTNLVGQRLVAQIRKILARKILGAPIDTLERYRSYRLTPVLTQDVDMISDVAFTFSSSIIAFSIALGCFGYLAWLSPVLFGLLLVALVVGATIQTLAQAHGIRGVWGNAP